jgi:hypothetical protein
MIEVSKRTCSLRESISFITRLLTKLGITGCHVSNLDEHNK